MSQNGRPVDSAQIGWKDVVSVQGPTGILLRFDKLASEETPFMYLNRPGFTGEFLVQ